MAMHYFTIEEAEIYGLNIAIFKSELNQRIQLDSPDDTFKTYNGKRYIRLSLKDFCTIFPYWSEKTIRRIIQDCLSHHLIDKKNLNDSPFNSTGWYKFTE